MYEFLKLEKCVILKGLSREKHKRKINVQFHSTKVIRNKLPFESLIYLFLAHVSNGENQPMVKYLHVKDYKSHVELEMSCLTHPHFTSTT